MAQVHRSLVTVILIIAEKIREKFFRKELNDLLKRFGQERLSKVISTYNELDDLTRPIALNALKLWGCPTLAFFGDEGLRYLQKQIL